MEDIKYHADRTLDRGKPLRPSSYGYIHASRHIIMGASSNGKTYLSNVLGVAACRNGFTVRYVRITDLMNGMTVARGEGTYLKMVRSYPKADLLITDEFLLTPMTNEQANDLLEVIGSQSEQASIIFCTQFEPDGRHERIGSPKYETLSVIDRICPNAYEVLIEEAVSVRERHGVKAPEPERQVTAMPYNGYNAWDECPEANDCMLIRSFLELVDAIVRDIQYLNLKTTEIRARYRFAMETDPERKRITTVDILSYLDIPHYDSLAYQEFSQICYDGGDPWPSKSSQTPWYSLQRGSTTAGIKLTRFHYD